MGISKKERIRGVYRGRLVKEVDNIAELYDEGYYTGEVYPRYTMASEMRINERRIALVNKFWKGPAKILDVGCATGLFLSYAKQAELNPYGVDISEYAIQQAKKLHGESVVCCDVEENVPFDDAFFDIITCWDVIEHFKHPSLVLKKLGRKLKNQGLLFVETCNYDSITRKMMKGNWAHYAEGYHQTPEITIEILKNWLRGASLMLVEAFTDSIHVPLSDQLIRTFPTFDSSIKRVLYPVRLFEYAVGRMLENTTPNLGDLLYCIAKKYT